MARSKPAKADTSGHDKRLHELQEKLNRYELIFRATKDILYDIDLQKACVDWNEALYTQYGYSHSEPTGTLEWWAGHVHPDDAMVIENKIANMVDDTVSTWEFDYRFQRADGRYSYVRDRGILIKSKAGEPVRIIGTLLDMTAQKQLDIAKDEFISLVSHQLRTPLTVIRVYGEMLSSGMSGDLNTEQSQWVRNMTNSSARLIDVVGDILNVSKLDLGRINIVPQEQDFGKILAACVREVQPLADEKKVTIKTQLPKTPVIARVDETIVVQIVHNLLTNAIRYTQPIKGKVMLRLKSNKDHYVLSVTDNGIGIPKSAQAHIFDRFYRAKNALVLEAQGSGLGLYLIKVMCDAFGGKVWFESALGSGTTFYVQVPKSGMASRQPD